MFKCIEIIDRCNELSILLLFISFSLLSSRRMGEEQEQILPLGGHGLEDGRGSSLALLSKGSASPEAVITGIPQRACRESAGVKKVECSTDPLAYHKRKQIFSAWTSMHTVSACCLYQAHCQIVEWGLQEGIGSFPQTPVIDTTNRLIIYYSGTITYLCKDLAAAVLTAALPVNAEAKHP